MVEYKCTERGCAFQVDDAPHIDACVQTFREHFRGAHPTKYLNSRQLAHDAASFNLAFEEFMVNCLGDNWADAAYIGDAIYYVQRLTKEPQPGQRQQYRQSTIDEGKAWLEANLPAAQAQGVADANARPRFRPGRPRPRGIR